MVGNQLGKILIDIIHRQLHGKHSDIQTGHVIYCRVKGQRAGSQGFNEA